MIEADLCQNTSDLVSEEVGIWQSHELQLKFEGVCQNPKYPVYCERSQAFCATTHTVLCYGIKPA